LTDAPKTLNCAAPAIPAGVKRGVGSPAVMTSWKLDFDLDVAHEAQAAVDAVPKGDAFPDKPTVVIADNGAPAVWVIDGALKRHVINPASLSAWQFAAAKWPAAKIDAIPQGPDWPANPFVFKGDEATVFVLDVAPGTPPGASNAGDTPPQGQGSGGTGEPQGGDGPSASDAPGASSGGCDIGGATNAGSFGPWLVVLGLALLGRRRR
jgi:uncharacterized protein (TIGR03382 family)